MKRGRVIWLYGRPCSGKTTIARALHAKLAAEGTASVMIDGDRLRNTFISGDLGFSPQDRAMNIKRAADMARIIIDSGVIVIASFITPTLALRKSVLHIIGDVSLIYVKCSFAECASRDVKGHYKRALLGVIPDFTGVGGVFEEPSDFVFSLNTEEKSVERCVGELIEIIRESSW